MPTTPFDGQLVSDLAGNCAWKFWGELGEIFTPRALCCTDPNELGIVDGKTPVAVIQLSPNPGFPDDTISYDGSTSYDPDGSVVSYAWTFEGHTPASGTAVSGTLNWGTPGTFNVTLVVTDGTGIKSSPARVQVVLAEADFEAYVATAGSGGIFYTGDAGQTWTGKNSTGFASSLSTYTVAIDPNTQHLPAARKTIWRTSRITGFPGLTNVIMVSNDGGANWSTKAGPSANPWSDGATIGTPCALLFVPGDRLFMITRWQTAGLWRMAMFYTDDVAAVRTSSSATITWTQVTTTGMQS